MPRTMAPDGTDLFYKDLGDSDRPVVLLLHSWALDSGIWEYQIPGLLQAGYRVVALDRRGHGRSGWTATGLDVDTLVADVADVADVATVLDSADIAACAVVAHSTGCLEAVRLAAGRDRISALVLIATTTPWVCQPDSAPA